MKIAVIGATGFIGSHILAEALDRGHTVTAIVRNPERLPERANLTAFKGDVYDADALAALLGGHEAVISAFSADKSSEDFYEAMVSGVRAVITATKKAGVPRLLAVGGAGSLEVAPGRQVVDEPDFPPEWRAGSVGTREFLYLLREEPDLDWTYLSPAQQIHPGERTGVFRLGGDQLMSDAEGRSHISLPDYAAAMINELEHPRHGGKRFSVAY